MLWIKALHLIFMVCWFAGLFYLPRLFVYHAAADDEKSQARFKIMERKLYYGIMMPSMLFTIIFGSWLLVLTPFYLHTGWIKFKLLLILLLIFYHFYCGHLVSVFKKDKNTHSSLFYRWFNEFPAIILIGIILLAVLKPF
jgi:putative membrane protein